jgi:hypothetical protein
MRDLEYMRGTCAASRERVRPIPSGIGSVCTADRHTAEIISSRRGAGVGRATVTAVGNPARRIPAELADTGHCPTTVSSAPSVLPILSRQDE